MNGTIKETKEKVTKQAEVDPLGCVAWAVENMTFALGMLLMFSKTVDLMTAFAPGSIFGYSGMEVAYGLAVGVLIEGALFVMKLTLPRARNLVDWAWTVLVIVAPFVISALAQVFDSFQVRATMAEQPQSMQMFVSWFVPSIPTVIMALLLGKSIFSSMPDDLTTSFRNVSSNKHMAATVALPSVGHAPLPCAVCRAPLAFIEYGTKPGKDGKVAKWPIYEKCKNPQCSTGRKTLGLPRIKK